MSCGGVTFLDGFYRCGVTPKGLYIYRESFVRVGNSGGVQYSEFLDSAFGGGGKKKRFDFWVKPLFGCSIVVRVIGGLFFDDDKFGSSVFGVICFGAIGATVNYRSAFAESFSAYSAFCYTL